MTFLIADDNRRMRDAIKRFLLRALPNHHTFFEASDGSDAVEQYRLHLPDWVLMDIEMEPMDGFAAMRAIHAAYPDARIIIVTSFDDAQYRREASRQGARGYVMKSNMEEMKTILSPFCESRGA